MMSDCTCCPSIGFCKEKVQVDMRECGARPLQKLAKTVCCVGSLEERISASLLHRIATSSRDTEEAEIARLYRLVGWIKKQKMCHQTFRSLFIHLPTRLGSLGMLLRRFAHLNNVFYYQMICGAVGRHSDVSARDVCSHDKAIDALICCSRWADRFYDQLVRYGHIVPDTNHRA